MYLILLFIISLLVINYFHTNYQGYLNYEVTSFQGVDQNCPKEHANNYYKLVSKDKLINFFGKYSNEFSNIETDGRAEEVIPDIASGSFDSIFQKKHNSEIKKIDQNYPENKNIKKITEDNTKSAYKLLKTFGYTKNYLFDITTFIESDLPLPTDPDFFKHI